MATNGFQGSEGAPEALSRIDQALRLVHDPTSSNDHRRDAQTYLEGVKESPEAPLHGYRLASDKSQEAVVRHYALSLLEHAIRYLWANYSEDQAAALRNWVVELNQGISPADPPFLRNKTAQLWVEVAKRSWGSEWMDMDSMLVQLWEVPDSSVHKEVVLFILETLSDEVFTGDDAVVAFREGILSKACVEVFTPLSVLLESFPNRQAGPDVRQGTEGWLSRLSAFLEFCLTSDAKDNEEVKSCAVKGLSTFLSLMPWAIPKAIAAARCVDIMLTGLNSTNIDAQKLSLEALYALFVRSNFNDEEFLALVAPMYSHQTVQLLRNIYDWATVDPEDIDDDKYQVLKKLAELLSPLGDYFQRKNSKLPADAAKNDFMQLLVHVAQSQSLMVSIPVLVAWNVILGRGTLGEGALRDSGMVTSVIAPLLELCCTRLVRYENLPEDSNDPTYLFLMEDTDTLPERHAFLGNYRRYSSMIIENIVQLQLNEAISHVLTGTEEVLLHLYDGQAPLDKQSYSKHSMPVLRVDARFTVIEACLKGYTKWRKHHKDEPDHKQQCAELETNLEAWCRKLLGMKFEDPMIRKRTLQLLVYFSTTALKQNTSFMLNVLEHILMTWPTVEPEYRAYNDAIKDLQSESMVELQRLASEVPDDLLNVYEQIEGRVNEMISSGTLDEKRSIAYRSFLFIIIHRASQVDTEQKIRKLREFIDPVKNQWQSDNVQNSLKSYSSFCEFLGLDKAQVYLANRRAHEISDWGSCPLDEEGLALQAELDERLKALPLRPTKSFLAFSVERLDKSSAAFQASYALWQEGFPNILADLLKFLGYAHAAHNPSNWEGLPNDMRGVVHRVLSDRFWQAGISDGSKDDFYARVMDKKSTLEGLASSIRGSVRFVRETAYAIIYCMSRLDGQFYGCDGLSDPLSRALFTDSIWLSTHQQSNLLNLVRYLVDDCPVDYREQFLPQLLAACFQQMDAKINGEWEKLAQQQTVSAEGDDALKEEMKAESILRQVTYTAVVMVADFLDPNKPLPRSRRSESGETHANGSAPTYASLRKFCLAHREVAEPLLLFCLHGTRMKDHRCCSMVLRLFVSLVPEFRSHESKNGNPSDGTASGGEDPTTAAIRDFIALDVLQACITSFHEPYFVELQKDLATLIASIIVYYSPVTNKPRDVILSLPNVNQSALERLGPYMSKPNSHVRQQRAIVLDVLKNIKGVSVSEMGKMQKSAGLVTPKRSGGGNSRSRETNGRSRMAQQFMQSATEGEGNIAVREQAAAAALAAGGDRKTTPDGLEEVANLFELQG